MNARRRGATMIVALVTLLIVMLFTGMLLRSMMAAHRRQRLFQHELQAEWLATGGIDRARARMARESDYAGETWRPPPGNGAPAGVVEISVARPAQPGSRAQIIAIARYPDDPARRALVRREYTIPIRPASDSASSEARP